MDFDLYFVLKKFPFNNFAGCLDFLLSFFRFLEIFAWNKKRKGRQVIVLNFSEDSRCRFCLIEFARDNFYLLMLILSICEIFFNIFFNIFNNFLL